MMRRALLPVLLIALFAAASGMNERSELAKIETLAFRLWDSSKILIMIDTALGGGVAIEIKGDVTAPSVISAVLDHYSIAAHLGTYESKPAGKMYLNRNKNWRYDTAPRPSDRSIYTVALQMDERTSESARTHLLPSHVYFRYSQGPQRVTFLEKSNLLIVTARRHTTMKVVRDLFATASSIPKGHQHEGAVARNWWCFPFIECGPRCTSH